MEEILALVRSQNRSSDRESAEAEDEVDLDAINPRSQAVWYAVDSVDPTLFSMDDHEPNKYVMGMGDGRKYTIRVPHDTPLEKIKEVVISQLSQLKKAEASSQRRKAQN